MDSITVNGSNPVETLDTTKASEITSLDVIYLTQGMLFRLNAQGQPVPDLVATDSLSANKLTFTITLRHGATYSDGEPVTANDVVVAFNRQRNGGIWGPSLLASIKQAVAVGTNEVQFKLLYPDPDIITELTGRTMAINPASKVENDPNYFNHPVSAGPYMVQNYVPGQLNTTLVENPKYWGGPMMAKKITVLGVSDDESRTLQIQSGNIDFAWKVPYASRSALTNVKTTVSTIGGYIDLYINGTHNDAFANPDVRRAISLALNRSALSQQVYQGLLPAETSWMYDCGSLCAPDLLPNGGKQDLTEAKQLIAKAGASGASASLDVDTTDDMNDLGVAIASQLKAIGLNISIKEVDAASLESVLQTGKFQMLLQEGAQILPWAALQTFFSDTGSAEYTGIKNPQLTALVTQAKQTLDPTKRKQLFTEIQQMAQQTMPVVPLLQRTQINAFSSKLPSGLIELPPESQTFNVQTVAEAKAGKGAGQ